MHYLKYKLSASASRQAVNQPSFRRARGSLVTLPRAPSVERNQNPSWDHCINSVKTAPPADTHPYPASERAHAPFPPAPDAARSPAPRAHQAFRGHETFTLTKLQSCSSGLRCKYLLTTTIKATLLIDSRVHFLVYPTRRFNPRSLSH